MRFRDDELYCYLGGDDLRAAIEDQKILDALLVELRVQIKPALLRTLSPDDKFNEVERAIDNERSRDTSEWFNVAPPEVLAALIYRCSRLSDRFVSDLFRDVSREEDLLDPVADWIEEKGMVAYDEVPMGRNRADVVGYRKGNFLRSPRIVAVENKNTLDQLKRGLDQMTTFREYAHVVYLACVPALAAEFLHSHAEGRGVRRWDPAVLDRKVESFGFGLLLAEDDDVNEIVKPIEQEVAKDKLAEVIASIDLKEPL